MAQAQKFQVSAILQSDKQLAKGICSIVLSVGGVSLFGSASSPEQLTITRTVKDAQALADLKATFPIGMEVTGFKTRKLSKPWTNTQGRTIRHRLFLSNNEQEHLENEALVTAEYAKFAASAPAPQPVVAETPVAAAMQPLTA